jgi:RNA-directed DNA polymerase
MPEDALPNGGALAVVMPDGGVGEVDIVVGPRGQVLGMQAKLHRWAAADPGRRFDDLFVRHEAPV